MSFFKSGEACRKPQSSQVGSPRAPGLSGERVFTSEGERRVTNAPCLTCCSCHFSDQTLSQQSDSDSSGWCPFTGLFLQLIQALMSPLPFPTGVKPAKGNLPGLGCGSWSGGAGRWSVVDVLLPAVRTPLGGLQIPKALPALHPHDQHTLSMEVPAHRPALGVGLGGPLSHEIWALH